MADGICELQPASRPSGCKLIRSGTSRGVRCVGDLGDASPRAQQLPDSLVADSQKEIGLRVKDKAVVQSFPTEAKARQKQKQKQLQVQSGEKPESKRKKKVAEEHYDDCGDDLSSLGDTKNCWLLRSVR